MSASSSLNLARTRSTSAGRDGLPSARPARPPLQNRTYSAPVGKLHLQAGRSGKQDAAGFTAIAENEVTMTGQAPEDKEKEKDSSEEAATSGHQLPQVNLAVVGAAGVGKSTFVKCALDLKQTPLVRSSIKKMSMDGAIYVVRLLEIAIHKITLDDRGRIVWPKCLGEQALPPIDGVLCLFDSTDLRSVSQYPQVLDALRKSTNIPFLVIACKCDGPQNESQQDPLTLVQACRSLLGLKVQRISASHPESHKKCISTILRAIIMRSADVASSTTDRLPLSASSSPNLAPSGSSSSSNSSTTLLLRQPVPRNRPHTRASSENPRPSTSDTIRSDRSAGGGGGHADTFSSSTLAPGAHGGSRYARSNSQPVPPRTPPGSTISNRSASETIDEDSPPGKARYRNLRTTWRHSAGSDAFSSFLDMDDELDDSRSARSPSSQAQPKEKQDDTGCTLDELVDRLLSLPLSKQDAKFPAIFLCLYRKFATPFQVLTAIITRFEHINCSRSPLLTRHADQLRFLNVLAQWVSEYPGDFAGAKTRRLLIEFIASLEKNIVFAFAAKEMNSYLEKFVEDDDLCWAYTDEDSLPDSTDPFVDTTSNRMSQSMGNFNISDMDLDLSSQNSNLSTTSSADRAGSISSQSFRTLLTVESAQQEAQKLELVPRNLLTKTQWRIFMDIPDEEFAREVTRMDWIMYSSFRPRELIRHVSLSGPNKGKSSAYLENVNRMIKSFNHLAFFVASMVLLRDKAKHRAQALEKFMNISLKLRQLNNYNALGAVIAGLNGTPVSRLSQTRELVPPTLQKQFMSVVILMSTEKSHFAYRLAWGNSFNERIPFLPLHLRDLVSAEEGNKTFVGANNDRINWRKFEVMGDVILSIQQSQKTSFPTYTKHDITQWLILEAKFAGDEEELYSRSMQVEASASGIPDPGRKRFVWRRP
ncbi:hypothetical protein H103_03485 [Trichophyton rubrum CBS 288.86]|uniref:Ras guanyl-nucleotide exchange factor RasGEF n=2 Tax=Trichophyton rubrum TaxID=5551 RepID=A0A178EZ11_TRIRU|nr:hypothetical protein H102_03475 [Trichophyton rubrum CBS 100081]EZF53607.1 hypothetical protein H103_03485 [Trichophyton rubrum CBS 288.86]EZF85570.1 hypothetical protein H110_03481 [Trichophyton rubrum MR1448]OAL64457.1 Ras guanyl-nucleotide exchange factor RasGEF [Trichophyton rubrum]